MGSKLSWQTYFPRPRFTSSLTADLRRKLEDSGADLGQQLKLQGALQELLKKPQKSKKQINSERTPSKITFSSESRYKDPNVQDSRTFRLTGKGGIITE